MPNDPVQKTTATHARRVFRFVQWNLLWFGPVLAAGAACLGWWWETIEGVALVALAIYGLRSTRKACNAR